MYVQNRVNNHVDGDFSAPEDDATESTKKVRHR